MEKPKRDNTNTVWLKGQPGEPRLSLNYRVKLEGAHKYATLGAILGFVNVRTLRQNRKVNHSGSLSHGRTKNNWKIPMLISLMREKGIYLLALQETRRTSGVKEVGNGYLLVTSQNGKYSWLGGTGFLLSPAAAEAFRATNCTTWSPPSGHVSSGRYLEIELASAVKKEGNIVFGNPYAPTSLVTMEVKTAFWDMIEERMIYGNEAVEQATNNSAQHHEQTQQRVKRKRRPARQFYMAMGDWNSRVGRLQGADGHEGVLGPHNFQERNASGSMMLDTMARCRMKIANTFFKHDDKHTATWTNPATKRKRVIDHVVVRGWHMRHVIDVKSHPGWNVDSDHEVCTIKLRGNPRGERAEGSRWKAKGLKVKKGRLKVDDLIDQEFSMDTEKYPDSLTLQMVEAMNAKLDNINTMYEFDKALREVMEATLPKQTRAPTWEDAHREVLDGALERRRVAMGQAASNPCQRTKKDLKDADKSLRKTTRAAMYKHFNGMCDKMESLAQAGRGLSRYFFKELSNVKRFLGNYEKTKHELVNNVKKRVSDMDNFFKKRFCQERPMLDEEEILRVPPIQGIDVNRIFAEPDADEILRATMKLKNGKAADITGIQAEALKAVTRGGQVGAKFAQLVQAIWRGEQMPTHWLQALGCTIWKGKHPKSCLKNWRVVNLIVISSKVLTKLLHWRMQRLASMVWSQTQYGFRPGAWPMDAVFVVTRMMEDFRATKKRNVEGQGAEEVYRNTLYWMFEDYSTAFDGVPRTLLWKILRKIFLFPDHIVELLKKLHDGFRTHSCVNNMYGEGYVTLSGVRQGCIDGPDLWGFHMQAVMWALAARMIANGATHASKLSTSRTGSCERDGRNLHTREKKER